MGLCCFCSGFYLVLGLGASGVESLRYRVQGFRVLGLGFGFMALLKGPCKGLQDLAEFSEGFVRLEAYVLSLWDSSSND